MKKFTCALLVLLWSTATQLAANGWLDWVPKRDSLEYCDTTLTDLLGAASLGTTALAVSGASTTTTTITPAAFLVAGESSLMVFGGTSVTVVTAPVVSTTVAVGAAAASVAYLGGKGLCGLSEAIEPKFITNQPIPLVMYFSEPKFGETDDECFKRSACYFLETNEVIPAGTPVYSLGPLSEPEATHYPDYQGRGLYILGRFFDHVYKSSIPDDQRSFVVVPGNSLNPILIEKYTHVVAEDTLVEQLGKPTILPSGTPFQLLKVRNDGWAKIELVNGFNLWIQDFEKKNVYEIEQYVPDIYEVESQ